MSQNFPKYILVSDYLRKSILDNTFAPGDKIMSESQICEQFEVSRQTARQAISVLENEKLLVKKRGSGTFVRKIDVDKNAKKNIAILTTYIDDYIFPSILTGMQNILDKYKYQMTICLTQNSISKERQQLLSLLKLGIDGLIVEGTKTALPSPNLDIYRELNSRGIPIVFINAYHQNINANYIINNDVEGGRLCIQHLLKNGHTKIGGIFKHDDSQGHMRYKGFVSEMAKNNIKIDDNAILWYDTQNLDYLFEKSNMPHIISRLKDYTAVVTYNDHLALRFINALKKYGISVPKDISLISFDNSNIAKLENYSLTSITHPGQEISHLATNSIITMMKDPQHKIQHVYNPKLIIRNSVIPNKL